MILKNTTGSLITIQSLRSLQIPASSQVDTTGMLFNEEINSNSELRPYIDSGSIVLNDGTKDLTSVQAQAYLTPVNQYTVTTTIVASGMTIETHEEIYSLAHNPNVSRYVEYVRSGGSVTSIITWTDSGKTKKIKEEIFTRVSGKVSQVVTKQYDSNGIVIKTETLTYTRTNGIVTNETIGVS
jgi:hypothetical protein